MRVSEPCVPPPTEPARSTASYDYDVGNRLIYVDQLVGSTHQYRYFNYDQRGFLLSEQHPEKGPNGGGVVNYGDYDAKGHPGYRYDTSAARGLTFTYDRAERLYIVAEADGALRYLKRFFYDNGPGFGNGKLWVARAWNYSPWPDGTTYQVDETYGYDAREGRVGSKVTQIKESGVLKERFDQTFTWSPGGELVSQGYPQCFGGACPAEGQPQRVLSNTFTHGHLTAVDIFASSITYHASGMVSEVQHTNGAADLQPRDIIAADVYGRPRPASMATKAGTSSDYLLWLGPLEYDGSGNVKSIHTSRFRYDGVSRLAEAELNLGSGTYRETYTLDGFGNLQSRTTTWPGPVTQTRATPASSSSNRLSAPAVYDEGGNLTGWNGNEYTYDRLNRMTRILTPWPDPETPGEDWRYVYTADDERLLAIRDGGAGGNDMTLATVRGLDGKVLREHRLDQAGVPFWDVIYRDGLLLTKVRDLVGNSRTDYHLDHLGTPRALTHAGGVVFQTFNYFPYGEETPRRRHRPHAFHRPRTRPARHHLRRQLHGR